MTKKYTVLAMAGTPITPCGTARLLVKDEKNDRVSTLTPQGPSPRSVSQDEFDRLEREGFATLFPRTETVEEGWYALYLKKELADELGGFLNALDPPPESGRKADTAKHFIRIPATSPEMRKKGWVAILGANELLWLLRKSWCASLSNSNKESNLDYLETPKAELLDIIEKRARLGIYCAEPEVTPKFHLAFAKELALVMKRHGDWDTRYRVYKYQIEPYFPFSWNRFEKDVINLEKKYQKELAGGKASGKTRQEIRAEERMMDARWFGQPAWGTT